MKKYRLTLALFMVSVVCSSLAHAMTPICMERDSALKTVRLNSDQLPEDQLGIDWQALNLGPIEQYTSKLYIRLTGSTLPVNHPRFHKISSLIKAGKRLEAAQLITQEKNFLQVRTRNFAAPFSSLDGQPSTSFNDLQALIIGVTRDELDARLILTGDLRYSGRRSLGLPVVSRANNDHFTSFDQNNFVYQTDLELVKKQWDDDFPASGALTTRGWASVYYNAGTNRRALKHSFETFLCAPIDSWKMRGVPDHFVRRDVDRVPGGNSATYQNHCRNCHGFMDGMGGAFAKLDFTNNELAWVKDGVAAKMNQNGSFYPDGYVTVDDSWSNLLSYNPGINFGWRTNLQGEGIKAFAQMLADSFAYSKCLTAKVYKEVCGVSADEKNSELITALAKDFEAKGRNLKYLFANIAIQNECLTHEGSAWDESF